MIPQLQFFVDIIKNMVIYNLYVIFMSFKSLTFKTPGNRLLVINLLKMNHLFTHVFQRSWHITVFQKCLKIEQRREKIKRKRRKTKWQVNRNQRIRPIFSRNMTFSTKMPVATKNSLDPFPRRAASHKVHSEDIPNKTLHQNKYLCYWCPEM